MVRNCLIVGGTRGSSLLIRTLHGTTEIVHILFRNVFCFSREWLTHSTHRAKLLNGETQRTANNNNNIEQQDNEFRDSECDRSRENGNLIVGNLP